MNKQNINAIDSYKNKGLMEILYFLLILNLKNFELSQALGIEIKDTGQKTQNKFCDRNYIVSQGFKLLRPNHYYLLSILLVYYQKALIQ